MIRLLQRAALAAGVFAGLMSGSAKALVLPSDDAIRELLAARLGAAGENVGIVVGIVGPQGRRVISYGHRRPELPLRVTFQTDGDGRVTGMLIYPPRGQKAVPANRLSGVPQ